MREWSATFRRPTKMRRPWSREKGSAFVELSLVVLSVYALLLGTIDLTSLLLDYDSLTKNVRDAAGYLSVVALDPATAAVVPITSPDLLCPDQTIEQTIDGMVRCGRCLCAGAAAAAPLAVTARYCRDHDELVYVGVEAERKHTFSLASAILGASVNLSAASLMRVTALVSQSGSLPSCTR